MSYGEWLQYHYLTKFLTTGLPIALVSIWFFARSVRIDIRDRNQWREIARKHPPKVQE